MQCSFFTGLPVKTLTFYECHFSIRIHCQRHWKFIQNNGKLNQVFVTRVLFFITQVFFWSDKRDNTFMNSKMTKIKSSEKKRPQINSQVQPAQLDTKCCVDKLGTAWIPWRNNWGLDSADTRDIARSSSESSLKCVYQCQFWRKRFVVLQWHFPN